MRREKPAALPAAAALKKRSHAAGAWDMAFSVLGKSGQLMAQETIPGT